MNKSTSDLVFRVVASASLFSFFGYALNGSWWFWNWPWYGIVIFFILLIFVVLIAAEEQMEKDIEEMNKRRNNVK